MVHKKCSKCLYYHKADAEHADDGCYYPVIGGCHKRTLVLRWVTDITILTALVISIMALVIRLVRL